MKIFIDRLAEVKYTNTSRNTSARIKDREQAKKNGENKMEWLKRNAMDCLKYGYGYKSFLEFNDYEKGLISDEEYKKAWHDAMEEMTKD